jgi:hypothetical protein
MESVYSSSNLLGLEFPQKVRALRDPFEERQIRL